MSRTVSIKAQLNLTLISMSNHTRSRQLPISTRTQACNLSIPNQWARSCQLLMSTRTQACNLPMPNLWAIVCFNEDQITLNNVIKAESLYQLTYLQKIFCMLSSYTYLHFCADIYIIVVKLITMRSCYNLCVFED